MMLVAVARGLVSDAMSKRVSVVISSFVGSTERLPYARSKATPARRPISTTQHDIFPRSMFAATSSSMRASADSIRAALQPIVAGGCGGAASASLATGIERRIADINSRKWRKLLGKYIMGSKTVIDFVRKQLPANQ